MNKDRRQSLSKQLDELEKVKTKIIHELGATILKVREQVEECNNSLEDIKNNVEQLKDEEQEYYDNMPEGLQNGEKGEAASAAIDELDSAVSTLDEVMEKLKEFAEFDVETDIDGQLAETFDNIDNAKGEI